MRKLKKYILSFICVIMVICQISNVSYSYTIDEVKEMTNFKTYEGDEEPEDYDILVDAKDLINNEKLPAGIKSTINDVLYSNDGIFNIDFFSKKSSKKKDKNQTNESDTNDGSEKAISDMVKILYKVVLYICAAVMLVLLIYIGILIVSSGISGEISFLPFSGILNNKKDKGNPKKNSQYVKLIEQWIISVIALVLSIVVMNLSVYFSNVITNIVGKNKVEENPITIYVKNSKIAVDAPILGSSGTTSSSTSSSTTTSTSSSGSAEVLRQKVVDQAKSLDGLGVSGTFCETWVERVYSKALGREISEEAGANVIIKQNCAHEAGQNAINTSSTEDNIIPGAAVFSFKSWSGKTDSTCGQDAGHVGIYIGDGKIASYTGKGETGVVINTIEEWKQSWDFSCWGWLPRNRRFS